MSYVTTGKEREHNLQAGDNVEVCEGELINLQGKILSVDGNKITIMPKHEDLKVMTRAKQATTLGGHFTFVLLELGLNSNSVETRSHWLELSKQYIMFCRFLTDFRADILMP